MAEIQSRPSAGASSRGGGRPRGGFPSRGSRASAKPTHTNGDSIVEDDAELALMRKYATEISQLKEIFPGWSGFDLASALQQTSGDIESAAEGITNGN